MIGFESKLNYVFGAGCHLSVVWRVRANTWHNEARYWHNPSVATMGEAKSCSAPWWHSDGIRKGHWWHQEGEATWLQMTTLCQPSLAVTPTDSFLAPREKTMALPNLCLSPVTGGLVCPQRANGPVGLSKTTGSNFLSIVGQLGVGGCILCVMEWKKCFPGSSVTSACTDTNTLNWYFTHSGIFWCGTVWAID